MDNETIPKPFCTKKQQLEDHQTITDVKMGPMNADKGENETDRMLKHDGLLDFKLMNQGEQRKQLIGSNQVIVKNSNDVLRSFFETHINSTSVIEQELLFFKAKPSPSFKEWLRFVECTIPFDPMPNQNGLFQEHYVTPGHEVRPEFEGLPEDELLIL